MTRLRRALRVGLVMVLVSFAVTAWFARPAEACSEPYYGQICTFAFNYCPEGFVPADGRLLTINQFQVLFALMGTTFGGDGIHNFAVPDLRGRTALGTGQGPNLDPVALGQTGGNDQTVTVAASTRGTPEPAGQLPWLGLTACIANTGVFPSRP
jgi:microcystin-dependent protein